MDENTAKNNAIRQIVPIKGNLLEKIKNAMKSNGSPAPNAEENDLINNNSQNTSAETTDIQREMPAKCKVIIQSVEKVQFKISESVFSMLNQPSTSAATQKISVMDTEKEERKMEADPEQVKLLLAKIPENDCNKEVPLKMVRTVRRPKPVPNIIRKRVGNLTVNQNSSTTKDDATTQHTSDEVKVESYAKSEILEKKSETSEREPTPESTQPAACEITQNSVMNKSEPQAGISLNELVVAIKVEKEENGKNEEHCEINFDKAPILEDPIEQVMDTSEAAWLNDISVMIGENRIKEIDQGLKKIPAVVTGNKIQTENVELKLIINHLLAKLKAESVTETLGGPSTSGLNLNDTYTSSSDMPTDFTDDSSIDSSFFNSTVETQESVAEEGTPVKKEYLKEASDIKVEKKEPVSLKRRGRPPTAPKMTKRQRVMSSMEESCDSEKPVLSKRESSVESQKLVPTRRANRRANVIKDSSRESSVEMKNTVIIDKPSKKPRKPPRERQLPVPIKKKVTKLQELRNIKVESCGSKSSELSSSDCESVVEKGMLSLHKKKQVDVPLETSLQPLTSSPTAKTTVDKGVKMGNKKLARKNFPIRDSPSQSLSKHELKPHSSLNDSNSKHKSSILERNDYLNKSSSLDKTRNELAKHPMCVELGERLKKNKDLILIKSEPEEETSISHDSKKLRNGNIKNSSKQKSRSTTPKATTTTKSIGPRSKPSLCNGASLKVFEQEELKKSIEKSVMYSEILEAIRVTDPTYNKSKKTLTAEETVQRRKIEAELKNLEHFRCGSCNFLVTKHFWRQHMIAHGGLAWIDKYEFSINIDDWKEAVRRLINNMRIYKLESLICPNCDEEKKSALGQLAHLYVCAQDEEAIERRKIQCEICNERVMPANMSFHRSKCKALQTPPQSVIENGGNEDDECSRGSSINSVGRIKRKSLKEAEKKFKKILVNLKREPHEEEDDDDFEGSSTDASIHDNESSESECSSGVESSEIESLKEDDDFDEDNDDSPHNSNRKAKPSVTDSQELKESRRLITPYLHTLSFKITTKTKDWTRKFINKHLGNNILTELAPKYKTLDISLSSFLLDTQLQTSSMKFISHITDSYAINYRKEHNSTSGNEWQELQAGKHYVNKHSMTIFCGGSIAALDWAQSRKHENFLAVACNSVAMSEIKMNLEHTVNSCIQVYKMQHLVNDKFQAFEEDVSTLLYMFSIADGPILSIRFHPFVLPSDERIGLLAVTTANQCVHVYSLPYLKTSVDDSNENLVISLEPSIICKLSEKDILFQNKYLMQVSTVNWYYREGEIQLLAAGYISGYVAIWMIDGECSGNETISLLPYLVFKPHTEIITALDFKSSMDYDFLLLTSSNDREAKVFAVENGQLQEISSSHNTSRVSCAEWCLNWPVYIFGIDQCFMFGSIAFRQPVEFGTRSQVLLQSFSAVIDLSMNHWLNYIIFICDSGDVLAVNPPQLLHANPKDRWRGFGNTILSYTDIIDIDSTGECGIVFSDIKSKISKRPKSFRGAPSNISKQLQINTIRFNRNELSHRFYAIGYETGFVRIRHLKNFK